VVKIYWTATGEVHALKGIDAVFPGGAVTAVVGPSGSGKSSLLRILAGLDRPTAGQVFVGTTEVSALPPRKRRRVRRRLLGYVFQRPSANLVPYLTVEEHLRLAARLRGLSDATEADELLHLLGLDHRRRHRPAQLSGGEQQRVAFAQAALGSPPLVVADEPTAELDSATGAAVLSAVSALAGRGTAFVLATHDPAAMKVADRILFLRHGALHAEEKDERQLLVIDAAGRIQLPPHALRMFPDRRAELHVGEGEVRITPP
jgi:putative ABC transport system ATP-binding protein